MEERGLGSPENDPSGMRDDNINISDVIEVIETDRDFSQSTNMFNGGGEVIQTINYQQPSPSGSGMIAQDRYVKIIEQPASKALRFRYECEGRSAGSIPGVSSTPENKTFPTIQIVGYRGRAVVVVSCVTKDAPHRPHPHNLVGREGCRKGVCTLEVSVETMSVTFSNLGIQCVKKKDIESALKQREEIRVDPFKTGFSHRNQPTSIDLNAVRLCFQVFLEGDRGKFTIPLKPVISEPIYDKKAMCDLIIVKLSDCVSSVDGGRKDIILLCEKVAKEDIQIRFYEEKDGHLLWEGFGDFQPSQVHKQTAIWFKAPRYKSLDVTEPVKVFIQLRRPSDGATSEPLPFEFLPLDSEPGMLKRKRQKYDSDPAKSNQILLQLQEHEKNSLQPNYNNMLNLNIPGFGTIKKEPRETTSPYNDGYGNAGLSPMYIPNPVLSPQLNYRVPIDPLGPTPPPPDFPNMSLNMSPTPNILPGISHMLPQNWNNANAMNIQNDLSVASSSVMNIQNDLGVASSSAMNIDTPSGLSSLFDLDSQQLELKNLNSSELATLNMFDTNNLSENLSNCLLLTDNNLPLQRHENQNMTDSLTRLANNTIDSICQLNDMYKQN